MPPPSNRRRLLLAILGVMAACAAGSVAAFGTRDGFASGFTAVFDAVGQLGAWGPVVVGGLFIPVCVLFLPGSPLTLFGGFAFGKTLGGFLAVTACISVGSTLGACVSFLIGRTVLREWVESRVASNPRFRVLDAAVRSRGFRIVLLARLSPVLPFNLLNYALGVTSVSFRDYALGSWLGMLPGTMLFVYLGATLGDLADVVAGRVERTAVQQGMFYGGLLATVVLAIVMGRISRRALRGDSAD